MSAQRGKWVGGVDTEGQLNVGVLVGQCLGDGLVEGQAFSMDVVSQWIWQRNGSDQVGCGRADARASCTGLTEVVSHAGGMMLWE